MSLQLLLPVYRSEMHERPGEAGTQGQPRGRVLVLPQQRFVNLVGAIG